MDGRWMLAYTISSPMCLYDLGELKVSIMIHSMDGQTIDACQYYKLSHDMVQVSHDSCSDAIIMRHKTFSRTCDKNAGQLPIYLLIHSNQRISISKISRHNCITVMH